MDSDRRRGWMQMLSGSELRANETQITDEMASCLGFAFCQWLSKKQEKPLEDINIAVGRDSRASGKRIEDALIRGITAADCDVSRMDRCTTPAAHMAVTHMGRDGAVMITASNRSPDTNGFKLIGRDGSLMPDDVKEVIEIAVSVTVPERLVAPLDIMSAYRERLKQLVYHWMETDVALPLLGLHVVVDASGGTGGFVKSVLDELGADTAGSLNLEPDPEAATHAANPEDAKSLRIVSEAVVSAGADLGILIDADGDRVALIDSHGKAINKNRLIALIAATMLEDEAGLTFVTDSVTSSGLTRFITEWGGTHYRYKRGYANVIREAKRLNAEGIHCPLAIETSGHAAFRKNDFIDDGVYLAMLIVCEALYRKRDGQGLFTLLDGLSEPAESMEIRLPIIQEDYRAAAQYVIDAVLSKTLSEPRWRLSTDNREGVRILFNLDGGVENAWFMLRLSVHDPVMPINAESDVKGGVKRILTELYEVLAEDNEELDLTPLRRILDEADDK